MEESTQTKELPQIAELENLSPYRGNRLLKRPNEVLGFTEEHKEEFKKCKYDPVYFSEKYIKIVHIDKGVIPIQLYEYQKKMIEGMQKNRHFIALACRQSGKCICSESTITVQNDSVNDGLPFETTIENFFERVE